MQMILCHCKCMCFTQKKQADILLPTCYDLFHEHLKQQAALHPKMTVAQLLTVPPGPYDGAHMAFGTLPFHLPSSVLLHPAVTHVKCASTIS